MELRELFDRLRGKDPEAEEEIRKSSVQFQKDQGEDQTPEEPGLEEDEVTNGLVDSIAMGPVSGIAKRTGSWAAGEAAKQGGKKALSKLEMPGEKPLYSEAGGPKGAKSFSEFIRPESNSPSKGEVGMATGSKSPTGSQDLGEYWLKWKSKPMRETQATTGFRDVESPVGNIYANKKLK